MDHPLGCAWTRPQSHHRSDRTSTRKHGPQSKKHQKWNGSQALPPQFIAECSQISITSLMIISLLSNLLKTVICDIVLYKISANYPQIRIHQRPCFCRVRAWRGVGGSWRQNFPQMCRTEFLFIWFKWRCTVFFVWSCYWLEVDIYYSNVSFSAKY